MRTPYYQYDLGILQNTLKSIEECTAGNPDWHVHYAIKANANPLLLKHINEQSAIQARIPFYFNIK